jgi:hypothetical protein
MTRARALKKVIRARAARTGERYTTARRHVLESLEKQSVQRTRPASSPSKPKSVTTRAGMSDARFAERTGHGLSYWFDVLDRFGAVDKGHTAAARHLAEAHKVDGWYAQGITVAYERARGVRAVNQRCDGAYEVSVSKTIDADARSVFEWLSDPSRRRALLKADPDLVEALYAALDDRSSKGFVVRADGLGRFRYKWKESTVQLYLVPKAGKVSFVATNMKLAGTEMVEERRVRWRAVLNALATLV